MRILVVGDPYCPSEALRGAFARLGSGHTVTFGDVTDEPDWRPTSPSELRIHEATGSPAQVAVMLDGQDVLVVQAAPVTEEILAGAPSLRLVCCVRGGPVNVDVAAATARGIPVVTTPGKNADAVAELTIAFVIMLARRLPEIARYVEAGGEFGHDNYEGGHWFGHDIAGHVLGLVGFGQIGRRVAVRARPFGVRVLAFDPFVDAAALREQGVEPVDLATLLAESDFVSLHARATPANRGLIGAAEVARMKPGACLVNTARDSLLDEDAVLAGLRSGRLAGLALDVVSPSPATGRHLLLSHPNVLITTHIGGATYETLAHGGEMAVEEIQRFAAGTPLRNVADRAALDVATGRVADLAGGQAAR
ncbi:MAG TPA: NAD(P)-dependent oxidoreductase [Candidatus Limnocylindrales bacterium]